MFLTIKTVNQAEKMQSEFEKILGLPMHRTNRDLNDTYPLYACGSGNSTRYLRTPFYLTNKFKQLIKWASVLNWPYYKGAIKVDVFPLPLKTGEWCLAKARQKSYSWYEDDVFSNKEEAIKEFESRFKKEIKASSQAYHPKKKLSNLIKLELREKILMQMIL